jgi:hypothetical protein
LVQGSPSNCPTGQAGVIGSVVIKELDKVNKIRKTSDFRKLFEIWKGRELGFKCFTSKSMASKP